MTFDYRPEIEAARANPKYLKDFGGIVLHRSPGAIRVLTKTALCNYDIEVDADALNAESNRIRDTGNCNLPSRPLGIISTGQAIHCFVAEVDADTWCLQSSPTLPHDPLNPNDEAIQGAMDTTFDYDGFDQDGFDKHGFSRDGLDVDGFSREAIAQDGFFCDDPS